MRDFESLPDSIREKLRSVVPKDVEKCVRYDLKNTEKYIQATMKLSLLAEPDRRVCFIPTRRSNIPCHTKIDTESMAQIFIPYSESVQERRLQTKCSTTIGCGIGY